MPPKRRPSGCSPRALAAPAAVAAPSELLHSKAAAVGATTTATPWNSAFTPVRAPGTKRSSPAAASPVFSVDSSCSPIQAPSPTEPEAKVTGGHAAGKQRLEWAERLLVQLTEQQPQPQPQPQQPQPPSAVANSSTADSHEDAETAALLVVEETSRSPLGSPIGGSHSSEAQQQQQQQGGSRLRQRALSLRAKRMPSAPYISVHDETAGSSPTAGSAPMQSPRRASSPSVATATSSVSSHDGDSGLGSTSCSSAVDLIYSGSAPTLLEAESAAVITELLRESNTILAEKEALERRVANLERREQRRLQEPAPWRVERTQSAFVTRPRSTSSTSRSPSKTTADATVTTARAPRTTTSAPQSRLALRGAAGGGVERVANAARLAARAKQLRQRRSSSSSGSSPRLGGGSPPPASPKPAGAATDVATAASSLASRARGLSAKFERKGGPTAAAAAPEPASTGLSLTAKLKRLQETRSSSRPSPGNASGSSDVTINWE